MNKPINKTLIDRIIHYELLYMLEARPKPEGYRSSVGTFILLLMLFIFGALSMLAENRPFLGYGVMYLLVAILPFLFGWKWSTNVFTAKDREEITKRFRPTNDVLKFLVISVVIGLIRGETKTFVGYIEFIVLATIGLFALVVAAVYAPFFLGRYLAAR